MVTTRQPSTTTTTTLDTPRTSALSSKITTILASTYSDIDIRSALETLDARGITNTPSTRTNLRLNALKERISCDTEIINDFGEVATQLRQIGSLISKLKLATNDIRAHVTKARLETAPVNAETEYLVKQQHALEKKKLLLGAFTRHFTLSGDEVAVLTGNTALGSSSTQPSRAAGNNNYSSTNEGERNMINKSTLDDTFFTTLVKAKRIHNDSHILLSTPSQRLGTDILASSRSILSQAYSKLHRTIIRDFKTLDLENPSLSPNLRRALRVLAERPALFQNALDQFSQGREKTLEEGFYMALTGNSHHHHQNEGNTRKPIEASAAEPLRYVGDMLAWAHGAAVGEREALEGLFIAGQEEISRGIREGLESEPWLKVRFGEEDGDRSENVSGDADDEVERVPKEEGFDGDATLRSLIDRNLRGVGRVLKSRMEVLIKAADEASMPYKIANLIRFYESVFRRVIGEDAEFMKTLSQIEAMGIEQFQTSMRYHVTSLKNESIPASNRSLQMPDFLGDSLEDLRGLLTSYDTSVGPTDKDQSGLRMLLTEALDSLLSVCQHLSKTTLKTPQSQVFAINCLLAARETLSNFPFTRGKAQALQESIGALSSELTDFQVESMLRESSSTLR